jgi:hypothetical protein
VYDSNQILRAFEACESQCCLARQKHAGLAPGVFPDNPQAMRILAKLKVRPVELFDRHVAPSRNNCCSAGEG